jgi:hypothetical protein
MVIRRVMSLRAWVAVAVIMMSVAVLLPVGVAVWYVNQYEKHACQALEILTSIPAPKPADPAANPSRELNYRFHNALTYWQRENGC